MHAQAAQAFSSVLHRFLRAGALRMSQWNSLSSQWVLYGGFCESQINHVSHEYANSFTSLWMCVVSAVGLWHCVSIKRPGLHMSYSVGIIDGLGSFMYHWTGANGWRLVDTTCQYLVSLALATVLINELWLVSKQRMHSCVRSLAHIGSATWCVYSIVLVCMEGPSELNAGAHLFIFPIAFLLMLFTALIACRTYDLTQRLMTCPGSLYTFGLGMFLITISTLIEFVLSPSTPCSTTLPFFHAYWHACWHIICVTGIYLVSLFVAMASESHCLSDHTCRLVLICREHIPLYVSYDRRLPVYANAINHRQRRVAGVSLNGSRGYKLPRASTLPACTNR
jgi:hypothetical protein